MGAKLIKFSMFLNVSERDKGFVMRVPFYYILDEVTINAQLGHQKFYSELHVRVNWESIKWSLKENVTKFTCKNFLKIHRNMGKSQFTITQPKLSTIQLTA